MQKRSSALFVLMVILAVHASSTAVCGSNTVYNFLRLDVSSRAAALAGSFVSVTEDPNTIFYNPAGLSTLSTPMGSVGFFKHLLDINSGYLSYSREVEDIGHFGVGAVFTHYGSFDRTDDLANTLGTFSPSDLAVMVGYSSLMDEFLHLGANLKFIHSSLAEYASSALAADVGVLYLIPESRASVGASLRNLGTQLTTYASTKEQLPVDLVIGGSIIPRGLPLLLNVNFHKLNEDVANFGDRFRAFSVGGEFTLSAVLQVRFGYNNEQRRELKIGSSAGLAGFSGGIGISVSEYKVDYSFSSLGRIGNFQRISIAGIL